MHDRWQNFGYLLNRPVPPLQFLQLCNCTFVKTLSYFLGRRPAYYRIRRYIFGDYCPRRNNRSVADMYARHDNSLITNPYIVSNHYIPFIIPCRSDISLIQLPLLKKYRKRIIRQRIQRMIRAVEKKLSSTGYRTEFPYDQPVTIMMLFS